MPQNKQNTNRAASQPASQTWLLLVPVLFVFLWAGGYTVAKIALQYSAPLTVLSIRFGLVVVIMLVAVVLIRPSMPVRTVDWFHLIIVGILLQAGYFGFSYIAFSNGVGAGTLALLMSLQPIVVAIAAPRWSDETVGWQVWLGLMLGLAGTAIVIITRSSIEPPTLVGSAAALIGLTGIIGASLWEKRFGLSHHPVTANLIGYAAAIVVILPLALWLEGSSGISIIGLLKAVEWNWQFVAAMAYLVIGNSVIAVGLLLSMIRAGEVSRVSALFYLVPPLAALIAWLLVGEVVPIAAWPGIVLAAAGVYIATRK